MTVVLTLTHAQARKLLLLVSEARILDAVAREGKTDGMFEVQLPVENAYRCDDRRREERT